MVTATYWAIRDKRDNRFLPTLKARAGFTWSEPTHMWVLPPRMFNKERSAKSALSHWLNGRTSRQSYVDFESDHREGMGFSVAFDPERKRENMEVVEVRVSYEAN